MLIELIRQAYKDRQINPKEGQDDTEAKKDTDPKVIRELRERGYNVDKTDEPKPTSADRSQI